MSENPSGSSFPDGPTPTRPEGPQWRGVIVGGVVVLLVLAAWQIFGGREEQLAKMSAADGRVTLAGAGDTAFAEIDRGARPEIFYHAVLHDAPLAGRLELSCEWVDPGGRVARHNTFRTRIVYRRTWPTHCRQRFGPAMPEGAWQVRLLSGERVLSGARFVLR